MTASKHVLCVHLLRPIYYASKRISLGFFLGYRGNKRANHSWKKETSQEAKSTGRKVIKRQLLAYVHAARVSRKKQTLAPTQSAKSFAPRKQQSANKARRVMMMSSKTNYQWRLFAQQTREILISMVSSLLC